MLLDFFLMIVLGVIVWRVCRSVHEYIPISRFHHYFIPAYSIVMFLLTYKANEADLDLMLILLGVSISVGWYETIDIEVKKLYSKRRKREVWHVQRGQAYITGWIFLLIIGLALNFHYGHEQLSKLFSDKVVEEILDEIDPFAIFTEHHGWYIWMISGISSFTFSLVAAVKIGREEMHKTALLSDSSNMQKTAAPSDPDLQKKAMETESLPHKE